MVKPLISGQLDTFSVDFYIACLHAWLGTCDTEETGKDSDKGNLKGRRLVMTNTSLSDSTSLHPCTPMR